MDKERYGQGLVTKDEIHRAPVEACHKELIFLHFDRLIRNFNDDYATSIDHSTTKCNACEQLARMTLVIRDYNHRHAKGEIEDEVESMVADIVDAALFLDGKQGTFAQPTFVNPLLFGREQEIAALMQEVSAQSADDVIELWNLRSPMNDGRVLPDWQQAGEDIAADIDWSRLSRRSVSDNDIAYHSKAALRSMVALRARKVESENKELVRRLYERSLRQAQRVKALASEETERRKSLEWPPGDLTSTDVVRRTMSLSAMSSSMEEWWGLDV